VAATSRGSRRRGPTTTAFEELASGNVKLSGQELRAVLPPRAGGVGVSFGVAGVGQEAPRVPLPGSWTGRSGGARLRAGARGSSHRRAAHRPTGRVHGGGRSRSLGWGLGGPPCITHTRLPALAHLKSTRRSTSGTAASRIRHRGWTKFRRMSRRAEHPSSSMVPPGFIPSTTSAAAAGPCRFRGFFFFPNLPAGRRWRAASVPAVYCLPDWTCTGTHFSSKAGPEDGARGSALSRWFSLPEPRPAARRRFPRERPTRRGTSAGRAAGLLHGTPRRRRPCTFLWSAGAVPDAPAYVTEKLAGPRRRGGAEFPVAARSAPAASSALDGGPRRRVPGPGATRSLNREVSAFGPSSGRRPRVCPGGRGKGPSTRNLGNRDPPPRHLGPSGCPASLVGAAPGRFPGTIPRRPGPKDSVPRGAGSGPGSLARHRGPAPPRRPSAPLFFLSCACARVRPNATGSSRPFVEDPCGHPRQRPWPLPGRPGDTPGPPPNSQSDSNERFKAVEHGDCAERWAVEHSSRP